MAASPTPTLVLVPEWGTGHLMSILESCKRILLCGSRARSFSITLLIMRPPTAQATSEVEAHVRREAASGLDIRLHHLPAVESPADAAGVEEFIARYIQLHAPHFRDAIAGMSCPVAALVLDLFATPMVDVARDLGVPSYIFISSTGAMLAVMLHLPVLHQVVTVEFSQVDGEIVLVHGLPPISPESMPCPVVDKKSPNYTWFMRLGHNFMDATGIIANTTDNLEPGAIAAVADGRAMPGRPVGPVLSLGSSDRTKPPHECVAWLEAQPPASVVFLYFGSMGWFHAVQVVEIKAALERCGHRFLWVLQGSPSSESGAGTPNGLEHPSDANLEELLPEGFLQRMEGKGLVWPMWAPQKDILAHLAVGGFVTHVG